MTEVTGTMADRDFRKNENKTTTQARAIRDDRPPSLGAHRSGTEEISPRIPLEYDDKWEHIIATYWG